MISPYLCFMRPTGLLYVELKSGYADNGPAWIGKGFYSKSGKTIYFNGEAFSKKWGIIGRYFGEEGEYWISGIKKSPVPWPKGSWRITGF